jgi:hypothetical protein
MVLVAFLGSRLGLAPRKLLRRKKMPRSVGEGKIRQRAGTTPPLAAARRADALVVPALWLRQIGTRQDRTQISSVFRTDRNQTCAKAIGDLDEQVQN